MIKFGILSTSSIAPRFIAAVRESGLGEVTALSSRTAEKAAEKAAQWQIPVFFADHNALITDDNVDVVYISAVNSAHYRWAKAALEAGKHVLCEKPCTTTESQTRELFRLAKEKGVFLMEAQKMLFLPAVLELKAAIDAGKLGNIRMAQFACSFNGSYNSWMYDESLGGGPLLSSGIYVIELLQFLFECRVESISGHCSLHPGTQVEDQYALSGRMENGVVFELKNSTVVTLQNGAVFYGEKGYATLPDYWKARSVSFALGDDAPETKNFPCEHELVYEVQHVADCLRRGLLESPVVTGEFSANAIAVLEQVKTQWKKK